MAGEVKLRFEITDSGTVKIVDDATGKIRALGDESEKTASRATKAFDVMKGAALATAAAVGAAATAVTAAVGVQIRQIDELAKLSRATGVAVEDLSGLQLVADRAGVSLGNLGTSLGIFSRRLVEAQSGVGKSGRLFDALGIDPRSGATTQQFLEQIADRFKELGTGAESTALAMELFGRSGAQLINLLVGGGDEIRKVREEAKLLGLVVREDAAAAIEKGNDNLATFSVLAQGVARDIAQDLAPQYESVTTYALMWAEANRDIVASGLTTFIASLIPGLEKAADVASEVAAQFQVLALWQEGKINTTTVIGAYAKNALPFGGSSNFGDILRNRDSEMLSQFREAGGGALLDALYGPQTGPQLPPGASAGASSIDDALTRQKELIDRIRAAMGDVRKETAATKQESAQTADEFGRITELAKLAPVELSGVTSELVAAQSAAVNLGQILKDSLSGAVENLIATGQGFNLADTMKATGKLIGAKFAGGFIEEKLKLDNLVADNFLNYLPGIAGQGADSMARNFGAGLRSIAGQATNASQVVSGSASGAFTLPPNAVGSSGGTVTFVDDFGNRITAPAAQAGAGSAISQGFTPAAAAAGSATPYGLLASLAIGGGIGLGSLAGSLASGGAFGSRAQNNSDLFGIAATSAVLAPFTFGLAPLMVALLGSKPPNQDQATRNSIADAFFGAGVFPGLFLAKEPPKEFRRYVPGMQSVFGPQQISRLRESELAGAGVLSIPRTSPFGGSYSAEESVFARLLGTNATKTSANLGVYATGLGLSRSQYIDNLSIVAQSLGSLDSVIGELTSQFQEFAINGKGVETTQSEYNDAIAAAVRLFSDTLPTGVDAAAIALANFEQIGVTSTVNLKAFNTELERQRGIAQSVQGGVAGAGTSAITALLTGGDPRAAFMGGLQSAVVGGVSSQLVTTLFANGGPLSAALNSALFSEDPNALGSALATAGQSLDMLTEAAQKFIPVLQDFFGTLADGTSDVVSRSGYADQRASLADRVRAARLAAMTPAQQEAYYRRQLAMGQSSLGNLFEDNVISDAELPDFNYSINQYSNAAFGLLSASGNYAQGSRQQRALLQEAFNALDASQSALSIAAESATMQDVQVVNMTIKNVTISQAAAQALIGG